MVFVSLNIWTLSIRRTSVHIITLYWANCRRQMCQSKRLIYVSQTGTGNFDPETFGSF